MKTEDRILKQKEFEKQRALEAEKRAQARGAATDISGGWAVRRARWDKRERKYWK
ncbi:MAG: hypothetical protein ISS82_04620 [Nanoarchaeota archaeon]|nr:hypothetical protein [Nanoarchaeota archaeon]